MAVGKSHRIVIEVDPYFKQQIYRSLKHKGLNLKEWFIQQVKSELLNDQKLNETQDKGFEENGS